MDSFNIQVMLKDGSFVDYEVRNSRKSREVYEVLFKSNPLATFKANADGNWTITENPANIDEDLKNRICKQLTGFHT